MNTILATQIAFSPNGSLVTVAVETKPQHYAVFQRVFKQSIKLLELTSMLKLTANMGVRIDADLAFTLFPTIEHKYDTETEQVTMTPVVL